MKDNNNELITVKTGNSYPTLNRARWLLGILLASILTVGLAAVVNHHKGSADIKSLSGFRYWFATLAIPSLAFGLFVFLSCLFVPAWKKHAGILTIIFSIIFIGFGIYRHSKEDGYLAMNYIIRYTGFIIAIMIGYFLSYIVFKRNKWTSS